jgi:hypothetical protein
MSGGINTTTCAVAYAAPVEDQDKALDKPDGLPRCGTDNPSPMVVILRMSGSGCRRLNSQRYFAAGRQEGRLLAVPMSAVTVAVFSLLDKVYVVVLSVVLCLASIPLM